VESECGDDFAGPGEEAMVRADFGEQALAKEKGGAYGRFQDRFFG
jgi:hypothetical protein